jgi:hypothetical protein
VYDVHPASELIRPTSADHGAFAYESHRLRVAQEDAKAERRDPTLDANNYRNLRNRLTGILNDFGVRNALVSIADILESHSMQSQHTETPQMHQEIIDLATAYTRLDRITETEDPF